MPQTQDSIENFCAKIAAGKAALKTREFMIIARIESLILEQGMEDALARAEEAMQMALDEVKQSRVNFRSASAAKMQEQRGKMNSTGETNPIDE